MKNHQSNASDLAFQAFTDIGIIAHLADNQLAHVLPPGTSTAQFGVLNHLSRVTEAPTIGQIAAAMQTTPATTSSTIKRMVRDGLVALIGDEKDMRVKYVEVTPKGADLRVGAMLKVGPLIESMPGVLDDAEWALLKPLLMKLRIAMDNSR